MGLLHVCAKMCLCVHGREKPLDIEAEEPDIQTCQQSNVKETYYNFVLVMKCHSLQFERRVGGGGGNKLRLPGGGGGGKISIGGSKMPPAKTPIQQARELLGKVNAFVALARQGRMKTNDGLVF